MKKTILNKGLYYFIGILLILVVWYFLSFIFDESNIVFPSILKVFDEFIKIIKSFSTYKHLLYTLVRMFIGFVISIIFAIIFGTISGISERFSLIIKPFVLSLKTIPTATLVFLFLVISGVTIAPIFIVILICFPILYESVLAGYLSIDDEINMNLSLENTSEVNKIIKVRLPLSVPYIYTGIVSSVGLSFKIEIMAEVLMGGTGFGLGSIISYIQKSDPTNMSSIFAYSLVVILLSILFDFICLYIKEKIS